MKRERTPLYMYERRSEAENAYLAEHGMHFSEAACELAVSKMRKRKEGSRDETEPIKPMSMEYVDDLLAKYGVKLERNEGYDRVYIANKCVADLLGSSVSDEKHLALYVKDVIDDVDADEGEVFYGWMDSMRSCGHVIDWKGMM